MIIKDLGAVSAYAYAVEKGYTGTEEEFATLMASYATIAEEAAESAESASASATSASASAQTATTKASEASTSATQAGASATSASQSAQTATTKASEASASASTASTKASEASTSASTASTKASEASAGATSAQIAQGLAEVARDDAIDAKTDAESARDLAQQYAESIDPENIYSAYPTDTASGDVASFADGADDIPMKSVKVAIEPVQDLNGQSNPYPAEGGKNLFDPTLLTESVSWVNRSISVKPDIVYTMSTNKPTGTGLALYFNNDNTTGGSSTNAVTYNHPVSVTSTSEGYVYISHRRSSGDDLFADYQFQIEEGSTATTYAPYSNICPISGWTGAQVVRTGKNLLDKTTVELGFIAASTGNVVPSANYRHTDYIPMRAGQTYYISGTTWTGANSGAFYNSNKEYVGELRIAANNGKVVPSVDGYARFSLEIADVDTVQLEVGSTATEYEPYTGNTYSVTFPTEAGTVYGGELDVTNGVLTVDRAFIASYNGETLPSEWISDRDKYVAGTTPTTGAQVCYKLSQAVVYHLTPTEIKSLLGDNNVWADAGDTEVTYRADTKLYIDKKIAEVINALS